MSQIEHILLYKTFTKGLEKSSNNLQDFLLILVSWKQCNSNIRVLIIQ